MNFAKFLRAPFLVEHLQWLLLGPFQGCQSTWCFSRNAVFSRMNIIYFGDAGDITLRCIFSGKGHLCFVTGGRGGGEGNVVLVTPSHIYRKYHISTHFLDKNHLLSFSAQRKNIIFSGKINTIFPDITKKIVFRREFSGKTIFPEHLKKIWYFQVFFWEKSSFFLCLRIRLYFREKEILSFLIIQERSYSSAIYLERPCFQNIWKKKI